MLKYLNCSTNIWIFELYSKICQQLRQLKLKLHFYWSSNNKYLSLPGKDGLCKPKVQAKKCSACGDFQWHRIFETGLLHLFYIWNNMVAQQISRKNAIEGKVKKKVKS